MLAPVHRIPQSLSVRCADDVSLGDVHSGIEIDGVVTWVKYATLCKFSTTHTSRSKATFFSLILI